MGKIDQYIKFDTELGIYDKLQSASSEVHYFKSKIQIQGCLANPDGANPDDRGNPDDFLEKG